LIEFFAFDVDRAADWGGFGSDEDKFEAIFENQGIEEDGVGIFVENVGAEILKVVGNIDVLLFFLEAQFID
jgi:hypothetical protein